VVVGVLLGEGATNRAEEDKGGAATVCKGHADDEVVLAVGVDVNGVEVGAELAGEGGAMQRTARNVVNTIFPRANPFDQVDNAIEGRRNIGARTRDH